MTTTARNHNEMIAQELLRKQGIIKQVFLDWIAILDKGGLINAYDPQAMSTASAELTEAQRSSVNFMEDPYAAITGADALLIMTEWKMFRQPDFNLLSKLKEKIIFDGRNMYDPEHVSMHGLTYVGIGRSSGPVPAK